MKKLTFILFAATFVSCTSNDTFNKEIAQFRHEYKNAFITDERSPLKAEDTSYLRFYTPDPTYKVKASFELTPESTPFDIPTVSGKTKQYRQYGIATFSINDTVQKLHIYQSLKLMQAPEYAEHLFIPFTDATSYIETYGGGRYIDLSIDDIKGTGLIIDFNKCYNPWCAFAEGYNCPIPPPENRLSVAIRAGELNYGKPHDSEH
ncbi:MAG: DUF1684 domain-containing protein [Chitinophagales bacterium]|nr:DUF1684 domain-containing protein [Chitinophagaceae bacterium]MCB9066037.1 DUF1684 domain-containing protein [Chitinophagales bacterium]